MGLDMYLDRVKKVKDVPFSVIKEIGDLDELKEKDVDLYNKIKDSIIKIGTNFSWDSLYEEVGYWRKANHIHKWFVDNVQNGEDDCNYYEVTKDDITNLLDSCNKVIESLKNSKVKTVNIKVGWNSNGDIYDDIEVFEDTKVADELLPTQSGFFFGGTEYDKCYLEDIEDTKKLCEKILKEFDFENYHLTYCSSW